jgi:CheY-like chemotaxis protein
VVQIENLGYVALSAANADEALIVLNGPREIDLLFTDMIMPGALNGRQLAERALLTRPSLRVLYTSGYTEETIIHYGRLDPGVQLLPKPYRRADLARMIRSALAAAPSQSGPEAAPASPSGRFAATRSAS